MRIAKLAREYREAKGWNRQQAAHRLGISMDMVRAIEMGWRVPRELIIRKMADTYDVDFDMLMISARRIPVEIQRILFTTPHSYAFLRAVREKGWTLNPRQWTEV